ncbi:MAG TPA: DUF6600 domain-containing protein, partial [Thermoanaerobaculia bacterium]|nr:DUF6600 domain-containing protein [Thermoanaerobaculia bacterium]
IDGGSEVVFEALAGSPDRQDRLSVLRLPQGNLQLVVGADFLGEGLPRVDTPNVTVYPRDAGTYRITADGADWSGVVARDGSAEVVTRTGSLLVRAGEEAIVEGDTGPRERVRRASREDSLELWGRRLSQEASYAASYVDDSLRYDAASLDRHGSWVSVEGRHAWRPRVAVEWRPYWHGRWRFSPLGLTWVSNEPWGWVPYHYGSWDYLPGYGWVWYPGYRFAPAWVYWNWTDHYAGWVPVGYYARHYYPQFGPHFGFRFGHYGWAGGHWSHYDNWVFCSTRYLGHRDQHRHVRDGDRFGREHRLAVPRQGLLTTDTRGLTRTAVQRSEGIVQAITARRADARGELPDVTAFIARRADLPEDVRSRILIDRREPASGAGADRSVSVIAPDHAPARSSRAIVGRPGDRSGAGREVGSVPDRIARPEASSSDRATPIVAPRPATRPEATVGDRSAPEVAPRPAARPEQGRPSQGTSGSWRTPDRSIQEAAPRAPERSPPPAASPQRIEPRPAATLPARVETRPAERPARTVAEPPSSAARNEATSWRERAPIQPERSREGASDRYSVPRRVIEGVRSNAPGSTPFRPATPPARVAPRPESPRVDPRVQTLPDIERSPAPRLAPRVEPRSPPPVERSTAPRTFEPSPSARPAPPPTRVAPQPSRSSSPSPPPRSASPPSGGSRSSAAPSRAPSRSSEGRSSSGRAAPSRERPPGA